jgi:endonuclease/exonuclease/phosphatase (EEP) superfamily protein YafD
LTWNAHKLDDVNFLPDLGDLSRDVDIILIQEGMHSENYAKDLINTLNFNFTFYKSFCNSDQQATGVMTLSRYNLQDTHNLVSPDTEPILNTPKVSGYAKINVAGIGDVHIINTHGLNFNFGIKFKNQIDQISEFISQLHGPVIWAGDFNTWIGFRANYLNKKAKELGLSHIKPENEKRRFLKLDHIYTRGLNLVEAELLSNYKSSDHWPIKAVFEKQ